MTYVIVSELLGESLLTYPTYEEALTGARNAWKRNPERVGMCKVISSNDVSFVADDEGYCQCDNRACECDIAEMQAVYLDAIAH